MCVTPSGARAGTGLRCQKPGCLHGRVFPKTSENSQIFVFLAVQTSNLAIETTVHVYKLPGSVGTLKYAEYGR